MYRNILWGLLLSMFGCSGISDDPIGVILVGRIGTVTDGNVAIEFKQKWTQIDPNKQVKGYFRFYNVLVTPTGQSSQIATFPPILAQDCSDAPANLGPCIAPSKTSSDLLTTHWSYQLSDGSKVSMTAGGGTGPLLRIALDGRIMWIHERADEPGDAIRGNYLMIKDDDGTIASKINLDNGQAVWSIKAPEKID